MQISWADSAVSTLTYLVFYHLLVFCDFLFIEIFSGVVSSQPWLHILLALIIGSSFPIFLYYRKHFCHISLPCFFLKTLFRCFSAEKSFMLKIFIIRTGKSLPTEIKSAPISHSENLRFCKK